MSSNSNEVPPFQATKCPLWHFVSATLSLPQLLPHWLRIVKQAEAISHRSVALGLVCNQAGFFLNSQGRYESAEPLLVEALEIRKTELGDRHPSTASSLFNLAVLYYQIQRSKQAQNYVKQALAIYIPTLGHDHPTTQSAHSWLQAIEQALAENSIED